MSDEHASVESPCIGLCQLGPRDQVCLGCGRHINEIASWHEASNEQQREIIRRARERLARWRPQNLPEQKDS